MKRLVLLAVSIFLLLATGSAQINKILSPAEFSERMKTGDAQIVDVRTPEEYAAGHLPEAMQANWNEKRAFRKAVRKLPKNQPLLIYCRSGKRSHAAASWLAKKGFTEIYELEGGFKNFIEKKEEIK